MNAFLKRMALFKSIRNRRAKKLRILRRAPDSVNLFESPSQEEKRKPVTIIIAIACNTGIVMAADSQTTAGSFKRCDTNKLHPIEFRKGCALIGEAGSATLSGASIKTMENLAQKAKIRTNRTVPETAETAMRMTREVLRGQNFGCTADELNRIISDHDDCYWLVGYLFERKPVLFKLSMSLGIEAPVRAQYAAIGSGRELAEYLLGRILWPGMNLLEAELAAAYVIEEVKKHNAYCSGQTNMAFVNMDRVIENDPQRVLEAARNAGEMDAAIQTMSLLIIRETFNNTHERNSNQGSDCKHRSSRYRSSIHE